MKDQSQINYFHSTSIQIRFNDIDKLGHVTNSVYQQYFDLGRMAYFNDVLKEQMDWEVEGLILANITIDYINPIELHDQIIVRTKVYNIGNKSLKMCQELYNNTTSLIAASSKSVMVAYSNKTKTTLKVPERWVVSILSFEK